MKIANWYGQDDIRMEDVPKPDIGEDEVLVQVKAASICGSELHAYEDISRRRQEVHGVPLVMGHEFSGVIDEVGANVDDSRVGERVAVWPLLVDWDCEQCRRGKPNCCNNRELIGLHYNGAFAEFVKAPASNCFEIPENVSFDEAACTEPLSVGSHAVNSLTPIELGDDAVVIGSGMIGLSAMAAAKAAGVSQLIAADAVDYRLDMAEKVGADITINVKDEDLVDRVMEITDGAGVDAAFEAVGKQETVQQSIDVTKRGKYVTVIGMLENEMELDMLDVATKETKITGSYGYTDLEFASVLDMMGAGQINADDVITHRLPLEDIKKGFELLSQKEDNATKVIVNP